MLIVVPSRLYGSERLNIPYATEGANHAKQQLDVLLPWTGGSPPFPVCLAIHGGGWQTGDKSLPGSTHPLTDPRANGIAVVTINYRLSGDAPWPAQIHDCKAALRWISVHGWKYHLDPRRVSTWGISAGGHLALLLATTQHVTTLSGAQGNAAGHEKLKCAIGWWNPLKFWEEDADFALQATPNGRGYNVCSTVSEEAELLGGAGTGLNPCSGGGLTKATEASPYTYVSKYAAPMRIEHGENDATVPWKQGENFHNAALAAGANSTFFKRTGYGHGIGTGWSADSALRAAQITFLQTYL